MLSKSSALSESPATSSSEPELLIDIESLSFKRSDRTIFDKLDLKIPKGKVTAIMGPSGIGKTTLLRLIGGQIRPDSGSIKFDGIDIPKLNNKKLYKVRKRMGMLFQSGALFTGMSVYDNVAFPLREHSGLPESLIHTLVMMKLEAVGLRGARNLMPSELSGGMARRAALARAIALDPELVLYDEPFVGQDPITMGVLITLIRGLNDSLGLTSIIVSHDVSEVLSIADHAYVIADGRVVASGHPLELQNSQSEEVKQFLQGEPDGPVPFHYPAPNYQNDLLARK